MNCRHCGAMLTLPMIDLGSAPPSNAYLSPSALHEPERWFPLRVLVCGTCWLAQTEDFARADELFGPDYAYFSSYSESWLRHARRYVEEMSARFNLDARSHVVEIAANDGYLLQYVKGRGIACTGVEPTASTAAAARAKGIPIVEEFFGTALAERMAKEGKSADLMAANNVLAHVPDINDFVAGFAKLLKPAGVATFEFPHLLRLLQETQFDTIYHEHYSYLSLIAVERIFSAAGLAMFDVESLPTHGGSLRVFAQRVDAGVHPCDPTVDEMLALETAHGLRTPAPYQRLQSAAEQVKNGFLEFLLAAKREGKQVAAYGAAAKGNTLLNFAGVRPDLLSLVVDRNPAKQGQFMPGSRIPIVAEDALRNARPAYVVVLPWNLKAEVASQLEYISEWGGRLVIAVPRLEVLA